MIKLNAWQTTPRLTKLLFLLAVFFVFAIVGIANDIIDGGGELPIRYLLQVLMSGLFAVGYAYSGIRLRGKIWIVFIPLLALQFYLAGVLAQRFPNPARPHAMFDEALERQENRLTFDGVSIIAAVALGYTGFIIAFLSESRRYTRMQMEKATLDSEMAAARAVQQLILPPAGESVPGFLVESVYKPDQQVGGDFFQIVATAGDGLLIVLGDVAGKGLPAAMLVSMLVGAVRVLADQTSEPAEILRQLHERLMGHSGGGFTTALAALVHANGQVTIANAGHLPPFLDGTEVVLGGALPLGIAQQAQVEVAHCELRPGGRIMFYSDGLVEARNPGGELFGFERVRQMAGQSAAAIAEAAVEFGQSDDITVVTVERKR